MTIRILSLALCLLTMYFSSQVRAAEAKLSPVSQACLGCHTSLHPGIVHSWEQSRHSRVTPAQGREKDKLARRVSSPDISDDLSRVVVGCAECHTAQATASRADTFAHNGFEVHSLVTPNDCAQCHAQEREQFSQNLMSRARGNLRNNQVFMDLQQQIHGQPRLSGPDLEFAPATRLTREESCYYCHGSRAEVNGTQTRNTAMGPMQFPVLQGWPNQGVGRKNPDGSLGSCSACHTRHTFSVQTARKPYTCKECHIGPDVPAYKVYSTSKHGNIASSRAQDWNFSNIPWTIGQDFTAPTCATCHISLTVIPGGQVVAKRTHRMNDRLP